MTRPRVFRKVYETPRATCFKPRGIPLSALETVQLGLDELEAVRLADLEGLYQEEAAERMGVSRQTFGNIVAAARKKIADALVNAKALTMEGGPVALMGREFICADCAQVWAVPCGEPRPSVCPKCGSAEITRTGPIPTDPQIPGRRGCGGRRRRCGGGGSGFPGNEQ